jgi:hypothetical protein
MRQLLFCTLALAICAVSSHHSTGQPSPDSAPEKKYEDFGKLTKGAKEYDGLFKLHHKDDHLYAEIQPHQFEKMLLCPIAIARGMGLGGFTLNFDEQWVLYFKRVGDRVQVVRRNVRFQAKKDSPIAKAVETTYTDSVLLAVKIQSINQQKNSVVIDLNDIFMGDFADLGLGHFDSARSTWHKVKAFPKNVELEVAATYSGGRNRYYADDSIIDPRGNTVVIHYGLSMLPEDGYQPRLADDRVGHFLSVVKDFNNDNRDTSFLRYINRWRLERADTDPKNKDKLSPPKKKIVFWIEKSVPDEYRAFVREGILEWNKAFEKVGFRDAIEVRQQENEDFDPEDINYNTFRWITTDRGFAMGPSRVNPLTGEILDADIIFDASMVRFYKQENQLYKGDGTGLGPASPIEAIRRGEHLGALFELRPRQLGWDDRAETASPRGRLDNQLWAIRQGVCQCGAHMSNELGIALMAMVERGLLKPGEKVPDEVIGQAIKDVTMHEVGHTLGLRHNFKASTMLKNEQLHDTAITRKQGLVGSVMDYAPVNLAPKGVKQGDYFTTTIGPYDYWAIEYAYKPLSGGVEGEYDELKKIAAKCAAAGLDYATDEDLYSSADPLTNAWDLGSDPMKFAQERMLLAQELMKGLADRVVDKGEGYQRARRAFGMLLAQYGNAAHLVGNYVGGQYLHRDHSGDPDGRDPLIPVPAAKQRQALRFLQENILTDKQFQFSPQLLRKLGADRWLHWGNEGSAMAPVDYPINERVLSIQRVALRQCLDPDVLARIQNNALKVEKEEAFTLAELFRGVTDAVWSDLPREGKPGASSVIRRNLQREHLKDLSNLVLGKKAAAPGAFMLYVGGGSMRPAPADARSLARLHLRDLQKRMNRVLEDKDVKLDDTQRAHLDECQERIAKVLNAAMQVND